MTHQAVRFPLLPACDMWTCALLFKPAQIFILPQLTFPHGPTKQLLHEAAEALCHDEAAFPVLQARRTASHRRLDHKASSSTLLRNSNIYETQMRRRRIIAECESMY